MRRYSKIGAPAWSETPLISSRIFSISLAFFLAKSFQPLPGSLPTLSSQFGSISWLR